jgi:hypothetical protein
VRTAASRRIVVAVVEVVFEVISVVVNAVEVLRGKVHHDEVSVIVVRPDRR